MDRNSLFVACFVCALVFAGCGGGVPEDAVRVSLDAMPWETVKRENAWRRAAVFGGGEAVRIDLVVPGGAEALRLGVLPRGIGEAPVHAAVFLEDRPLLRFDAAEPLAWTDKRIAFEAAGVARRASIVLQSDREFWVGPCEVVPAPATGTPPNVLVVMIDTLRQDHLSCYGYARATSPVIDALAEDGIRFDTLVPQSSWTRPSVATLLTGCYPGTHGAIDRDTPMRDGMPSLVEHLRDGGYETHAIMMNPSVLPTWNIGTDFDRLVDLVAPVAEETDDGIAVQAAIDTIANTSGRPWFLYLHLMGPHDPYLPPAPYDTMFSGDGDYPPETQALVNQYDGEIAYTDAQLGRLFAALKGRGLYDDTLIVVLSDHGEQFGEHGDIGHGHSLYQEELRVPFVVKLPGQAHAGTSKAALVEMAGIAPTLLATLGLPAEPRFQGVSFAGLLAGDAATTQLGYAALHLGRKSMDMARNTTAKLIRDHASDRMAYFNLVQDPHEHEAVSQASTITMDLKRHAVRMTALGASGLNILVTAGDENPESVEVVLRGVSPGDVRVDYFADCTSVSGDASESVVALDFRACHADLIGAKTWFASVEQDSAQIMVNIPADTAVGVALRRDGVTLAELLWAGEGQRPLAPEEALVGKDVPASPADFDPALLPRRFGGYVWYTAGPERIRDDALDPTMLQQLESLGYLR